MHLFIIFLLCVSSLQARWATREDAGLIKEFHNEDIVVHKDGTSTVVVERQEMIARDAAREYATGFRLYYLEGIQTLTIVDAKTILNGKTYKVPKDKIEDKRVASRSQGFDQQRQVLISFPKIEVGSKIYIKYKVVEHKAPVPFHFGEGIPFGQGFWFGGPSYWEKSLITIRSEIPLYAKVNDPDHALKITGISPQPFHKASFELIRPLTKDAVNEGVGHLHSKYKCWVSVSSFSNWEELALKQAQEYEAVINQSLPPSFESIMKKASERKGEIAQINAVTSLLNETIQYMGDWQSVEGRLVPRPLKTVVQYGQGDCKDFTAGTAAILRKMGYDVHAALVWRGNWSLNPPAEEELPTLWAFNHVMLKIKGKTGNVYWVDPTNFESMAQGIFDDVGGKMALVLDPKDPRYERIPDVNPKSAQEDIEVTMTINDQNVLNATGTMVTKGEEARWFTGAELREPRERVAERFFDMLAGTFLQPDEKKFLELPADLKSREVKDLSFRFSYDDPTALSKNNRGVEQRIWGARMLSRVSTATHDQVSDLYIGTPSKIRVKMIIKNGPIYHIERLNYALKTPWFEIERVCSNHGNTSEIFTTSTILKRHIPVEELRTDAYKKIRKDMLWNVEGVSLIVDDAHLVQH